MTSVNTSRAVHARRTALAALAAGAVIAGTCVGASANPAQVSQPVADGPGYTYTPLGSAVRYTSPHGSHIVNDGQIGGLHRNHGGGTGELGYPTDGERAPGAGYEYQTFERGVIYEGRPGTFDVNNGPLRSVHQANGGGTGSLGYPSSFEVNQGGAYWYQTFERGVAYTSPRGAYQVDNGAIRNVHQASGGGTGTLGYPTTTPVGQGGSYRYQGFERGVVYTSSAGAYSVRNGAIGGLHAATGGGSGSLGYPTSFAVGQGGSHSYQTFERATAYSSVAGAFAVASGPLGAYHAATGGGSGSLGYPTGPETVSGGVYRQSFERGTVVVSGGIASLETPGSKMLAVAMQQLGDRYVSGGSGPDVFDRSGLVYYSYGQTGVSVPRTTKTLWAGSQRVSKENLQPGDLIFYSSGGPSGIYHVAIYAGNGMRVHAPSASRAVEHVPVLWTNVVGFGRI